MPSLNLFRRPQPNRLNLRQRAAELKASLARVAQQPMAPIPASAPEETADNVEEFARLEFGAYDLGSPLKTPQQWAGRFAEYAMAMHLADRTLRMSKPEMMAFIRDSGERDDDLPEIMLRSLDSAQSTFDGWGKLLSVARSRYIVAASAESVEHAGQVRGEGLGDQAAARPELAAAPLTSAGFAAADQIEQAAHEGRVLATSAIFHDDGTVSYSDACGRVSRRPMAHWVAFVASQLHGRVASEITRQMNTSKLSGKEMHALESRLRRELRSDAVFALAFHSERAFKAGEDYRSGAEPETLAERIRADASLLALAPKWEAAFEHYQRVSQEQIEITAAANEDGQPGADPGGSGPEWQAWFEQCRDWRERTGITAAEDASSEALSALGKIEDEIATMPAGSLAGLKLKARVAQRNDDIGVEWPEKLGEGLARDILAITEAQMAPPKPSISIADRIDFASATLKELQAIHDTAELVGDVAQAAVWQGRCQAPAAQKRLGRDYNAAGDLMVWLSDEMTHVEHFAIEHMKKCQPSDRWDRGARLAWIAPAIIQNEDAAETAAFIGELATFLADEARG